MGRSFPVAEFGSLPPTRDERQSAPDDLAGFVRLISAGSRRYARDPDSRAISARQMLAAALNLYAAHTSPGEAALTAAEVVGEMAANERKRGDR